MFRQPKIEDLYPTPVCHKNIRWLDIAMNDSFGVRSFQSVGHLHRKFEQQLGFHWLAIDAVLQCLTFEQFHRDEVPPISLTDFVNSADIRMVERGCSPRLTLKTFQCPRIPLELGW